MFPCNTVDDGLLWTSSIGGVREGFIRIEKENANGDFKGQYLLINGLTIDIEGRCLSDVMWFHLPAISPAFIYWGEKSTSASGVKTVKGNRSRLKEFLDEKLAKDARLLPDEWIAEKGV